MQKIVCIQIIANKTIDGFMDPTIVMRSHILTTNSLARINVIVEQSIQAMINPSTTH